MTHCPCCGLTASSTLRGSWSSVRRTRKQWALPVGSRAIPHRMFPTSMYRPELCARPGVSAKPPLLCHSLRLPSGAWELTLQPGFPDTPRLFVGLSAGPVGHRRSGSKFPRSPAVGEDGAVHRPLPHFRNTQPECFPSDLSGSPNRQLSPESPLGMWSGVGRQPLSHRTPR